MLAAQVGVDNSSLSRIERGLQSPSADLAERLVKAFKGGITEVEILYPHRYL
jgi:transcriptional regulator with XRE-family HTH domain